MAIEVTENWSGRTLSMAKPWRGQRTFTVTGVSNDVDALAAVDATSGLAIPQINDVWPGITRLKCEGPAVSQRPGPFTFIVSAGYTIPETGDHPETEDDPFTQPYIVDWQRGELSVPVDRDLGDRPMLNMAGDLIEGHTRRITFKRLIITKNFPYFDYSLCTSYENAVNSEPIVLGGIITVAAQHLRVDYIGPAASYKATDDVIPMQFEFSIIQDDSLGSYPFQSRFMNVGMNGWFEQASKKYFALFVSQPDPATDPTLWQPVNRPIRLGLDGKPIAAVYPGDTIKVGSASNSPVEPPVTPAPYQTESSTHATFVIYQETRVVDLRPLFDSF